MNHHWRFFKRIITNAVIIVLLFSFIIPPTTVQAWKSNTHVYLAEIARLDALDGYITLPRYDPQTGLRMAGDLGPYPVDAKILLALQLCPQKYRAGALGPDAYPDVATGQTLTHPDNQPASQSNINGATNSSEWIDALWAAVPLNTVPASSSTCTQDLAKVAFATGYLTHAAGDMYGHTFINYFAGGAFDYQDNALQHIIIEGYVDKLIPVDETPDFYDVSIDGAEDLIYSVLVRQMPGKTLIGHITDNFANVLSIPRFFNGIREIPSSLLSTMNTNISNYQTQIDHYNQLAEDCAWDDTSCSAIWLRGRASFYRSEKIAYEAATKIPREYLQAWIEDIDAGLHQWVIINHQIALSKLFSPDSGRDEDILLSERIADYISYYLEPMTPLPDAIGEVMRLLIPVGYPDFVNAILIWGDNVFDWIQDYDLYGGITLRKIQDYSRNPESLFDVAVIAGDGPKIFRHEFQEDYLHLPDQSGIGAVDALRSDSTIQSLIQQSRVAVGEDRVELIVSALDLAVQLEDSLSDEVMARLFLNSLDYEKISSMQNTVTMDKLIMISGDGMDQLLEDIGYRCSNDTVPTPIMLGNFLRSLDKSDQGLDPLNTVLIGSSSTSPTRDNRLLMALARDPVAYRTVLQLQEGHSERVLGYLSQNETQCVNDPPYQPCTTADLSFAASLDLPSNSVITDLTVSGNLLYLTAGQDGFYIYDLPFLMAGQDAQRAHLQLRDTFNAQNIVIQNSTAYINDGQTGLISVDISNPDSPTLVSDYSRQEPPAFNSGSTDTYGIVINGSTLYSSAGYNGVLVFDITTEELQEIDQIIPPLRLIQNSQEQEFNVLDVDLLDDHTLIVTTSLYLFAFDISPEAVSLIMLAYQLLPEVAYRTTLKAGVAYVADGSGGLQVYNLSGVRLGKGISRLGGASYTGLTLDSAINNKKAIVAASGWIYQVDMTNISKIQVSCPIFGDASRVIIWNEKLFVAGKNHLSIFSLPGS